MEPLAPPPYYAPPWTQPDGTEASVQRRTAGWLLDHVVVALLPMVLLMSGGYLLSHTPMNGHDVRAVGISLLVAGGVLTIALALLQVVLLGRLGSTIGQRLAGYSLLLQRTGEPMGFWMAFGYRLLMFLTASVLWFVGLVILGALAWREPRRRTFVDMAFDVQSRVGRPRPAASGAVVSL